MSRFFVLLSCLSMLMFALGLSGCEGPQDTTPAQQDAGDDDDHADDDHGDMDNSAVEKALAELSEADQAAARKQKTCPVTKELLGSMGTPYKVTVNGQEVFLCCQGCEAEIKANPEKYLNP